MIFKRLETVFDVKGWGCTEGEYSFLVTFDLKLCYYGATYHKHNEAAYHWIGENSHPVAKYPFFTSRGAAIRACEDTYKQLINKN